MVSRKVQYGDGSPTSSGTIVTDTDGTTNVYGPSHTYQSPGNYQVTITIGTAGQPNLSMLTATIPVASLTETPIPASGVVGQPLSGVVGQQVPLATLSDAVGLALQGGNYSATIDYGDGSPTSVGTIITNADGTLTVDGPSHSYLSPGAFPVNILIGTTGQPNLAHFGSTATVDEAPISISGTLNPASDSGISDSDGITNDVTPNFFGVTAPGATVRLYATSTANPSAAPALIGQGFADANGAYSINTNPLLDGSYDIEAIATGKFGTVTASSPIESGSHPLVIDTVGPKITGFKVTNTLKGQFQVTFQDERSGLVVSELVDGANYDVRRPIPKPEPGQHFTISSLAATAETSPTTPVTVTGSVFNGHYVVLRGGVFDFTINASGITDVAGNALDGEFYGTFPTGDGHPGGDFQAEVIVRRYTPSGPIPFTTATPSHPGVAAVAPGSLAPKLKKPGLDAPPTSLPGVNTGRGLAATSAHKKVVTKPSKAKVVVIKARAVEVEHHEA